MSELTAGTLDTQAIIDRAMKQPASTWGEVFRFVGAFLLNKPLPEAETTTPTHITQARAIVKETFATDQAPEGPSMLTTASVTAPQDIAINTASTSKPGFFVRMGQNMWKNKTAILASAGTGFVARAVLAAKFTAAAGSVFNPAAASIVGAMALSIAVGGLTSVVRDALSNDEKIIAARAQNYWWAKSFAKGMGWGILGGAFGCFAHDAFKEIATSEAGMMALHHASNTVNKGVVLANNIFGNVSDKVVPLFAGAKNMAIAAYKDMTNFSAVASEIAESTTPSADSFETPKTGFWSNLYANVTSGAKTASEAVSSKVGSVLSRMGDMLTFSKPVVEIVPPESLVSTPSSLPADGENLITKTAATLPPIDGEGVQKVLREITPPEPTPEAVIAETPVAPTHPEVPAKFKELFTPEAYAHITGDEKMATWLKLATSDNAAKSLRAMKEITVCLMNSSDETVRTSAAQVINVMYGRAVDTGMTETPIGNEIERLISYAYAKGTFGLEKSELAATVMAKLAEPNGDRFTKSLLAAAEAKRPNVFEKAMKLAADTRQYILPRGPIIQNG